VGFLRANVAEYDITEVCHSLARQARDPVPNLSVKNVRVAVLRASD
jgi:hypothetical protein